MASRLAASTAAHHRPKTFSTGPAFLSQLSSLVLVEASCPNGIGPLLALQALNGGQGNKAVLVLTDPWQRDQVPEEGTRVLDYFNRLEGAVPELRTVAGEVLNGGQEEEGSLVVLFSLTPLLLEHGVAATARFLASLLKKRRR